MPLITGKKAKTSKGFSENVEIEVEEMGINKICKLLKISRASFYRYMDMPEADIVQEIIIRKP